MGSTESPKLPRGVTIRKHRNGETINITFTYKGDLPPRLDTTLS